MPTKIAWSIHGEHRYWGAPGARLWRLWRTCGAWGAPRVCLGHATARDCSVRTFALQEVMMLEDTVHNKGNPMGIANKGSPMGTTNKGSPEGGSSSVGTMTEGCPKGAAAQLRP